MECPPYAAVTLRNGSQRTGTNTVKHTNAVPRAFQTWSLNSPPWGSHNNVRVKMLSKDCYDLSTFLSYIFKNAPLALRQITVLPSCHFEDPHGYSPALCLAFPFLSVSFCRWPWSYFIAATIFESKKLEGIFRDGVFLCMRHMKLGRSWLTSKLKAIHPNVRETSADTSVKLSPVNPTIKLPVEYLHQQILNTAHCQPDKMQP